MKSPPKRALCLCLSLILVFGLAACSAAGGKKAERLSLDARPDAPSEIPEGLDIDWNARYTFAELEAQLSQMAEQYPDITDLYSIGTTWQERDLWCLEITNKAIPAEEKTGIGVFANIHGGERESASSAMYTAWWLTLCSGDAYVKGLLDAYTIYVIPVINPDGYEQSFVVNTRPNLRPQDANGNNIPFSDPYTDIDGDGFIATLYRGKADDTPSRDLPVFGMESPDWDKNGVLGDADRLALAETLDASIERMASAYALYDYGVWTPILDSIFYESLYGIGKAVLDGTYRRRTRTRYGERKKKSNEEAL